MNFPKFRPVHFSIHPPKQSEVISYQLIKTKQRLTFDIRWQHPESIYQGNDDSDYYKFVASNGYEINSRSSMDIQTGKLWLLGTKEHERSATLEFRSDTERDIAYEEIKQALTEWVKYITDTE